MPVCKNPENEKKCHNSFYATASHADKVREAGSYNFTYQKSAQNFSKTSDFSDQQTGISSAPPFHLGEA